MFYSLKTSFKLAFKNLRNNVGRTVFTLVGIVIGITSVIVIMASGQGVKGYVLGQVGMFGNDLIAVKTKVPATGKASVQNAIGQAQGIQITTLKIKDVQAVEKLPNVAYAYGDDLGQELVSYQQNNKATLLYGTGAAAPLVDANLKVDEGRFFTDAEDNSLEQVAVIGPDLKTELFGQEDALGKDIRMNNQNYKVIGVLAKRGAASFFNYDELVYIPIQTLQKRILGIDYLRDIVVKVKDTNATDETVADITDTLRRSHSITDPNKDDFGVTSIQEAQDAVNTIFGTINVLLLALTSISLVVGGVGIMNVMYVAVTERTFEIGLRKAVGAKPADILKQFLFEAVLITLAGGIVGIILGYAFSLLMSYVFVRLGYGLQFTVTAQSLGIAVGFSMAVGIIFGYYPARKASRLTPMEALRKE